MTRLSFCSTQQSLLVAVFCAFAASAANAQVDTGDVLGRVTDGAGATVQGALVRLENTGTHEVRTFTTKGVGEYAFNALQVGDYTLTVSTPGFKSVVATGIHVGVGDRVRLDEALTPGGADEKIEVTTIESALQTDNTTVGNTLPERAVQEVPTAGRNFLALVEVQPGVNQGAPGGLAAGSRVSDRRATSSISANGQNELFNNQLIDGLDNNNRYVGLIDLRPSVEAIQTVRTDINLYTAEEGRSTGAVINVITKSGTNQMHGSLFEFFRNDATDARNYFLPTTLHKSELRGNQFGGSLGGPIFKDRTFFFADYEGLRRIDATQNVYQAVVPTQYEHDHPGDLTDQTGGTKIATPDPTALGYFSLYPSPNYNPTGAAVPALGAINYLSNPASRQLEHLGDVRLDHHFNANNLLFGRYSYNRTDTYTPGYFPAVNGVYASGVNANPAPGNSSLVTHDVAFGYTHIFTPALLLELKTGYSYLDSSTLPLNYPKFLNNTAPFLIPGAATCPYCIGLAAVSITGLAPSGDPLNQPTLDTENTHQFLGDVIYTRGNHIFKAGAGLIRRNASPIQQNAASGSINFTGASSLVALTNFFKGAPYIYNRQALLIKPHVRTFETSAFVQDDWSATPKLKFNLGLRYDVFTAPNEKYGNNAFFDLSALTLNVSQTGGIRTDYHDIAPRFGFAFNPHPGTVFRGGFGLAFFPSDIYQAFFYSNPPYSVFTGNVSVATALSTTGEAPAVPQSTATANLFGAITTKPTNFKHEYVEQFNFLTQQDLGSGTVFTIGYVGEIGRHLFTLVNNIDLPLPVGPSAAGAAPPAYVYAVQLPKVTQITQLADYGFSRYNSLQTAIERRTQSGLTLNVNYTWAHSLDDFQSVADGDAAYGLEPSRLSSYDYGNSAIDVTNRFAGTFNYELPFGKNGSALKKALLGGVQFNGLGFWQSGLPVSISSSVTQNGRAYINLPGITSDRPDRIGTVTSGGPIGQFFNTSAFARQALGTAGNAGRNQVRGPHLRQGNLSLLKKFPIHERFNGEFRVECLDFTNTTNFAAPNSVITGYRTVADAAGRFEPLNSTTTPASTFGQITSTAYGFPGRQFQFALRFTF